MLAKQRLIDTLRRSGQSTLLPYYGLSVLCFHIYSLNPILGTMFSLVDRVALVL